MRDAKCTLNLGLDRTFREVYIPPKSHTYYCNGSYPAFRYSGLVPGFEIDRQSVVVVSGHYIGYCQWNLALFVRTAYVYAHFPVIRLGDEIEANSSVSRHRLTVNPRLTHYGKQVHVAVLAGFLARPV